jgi:hypothetical protein
MKDNEYTTSVRSLTDTIAAAVEEQTATAEELQGVERIAQRLKDHAVGLDRMVGGLRT